jgi:3-oxoacyl-(acyl-carrier-protein) synthase
MTAFLQEQRKMALFAQYAIAATEEALEDAGWKPTSSDDRIATVSSLSLSLRPAVNGTVLRRATI